MKQTNIFSNEELEKIYGDFLEEHHLASQETMDAYQSMRNAFEEYLIPLEFDMFRFAYQYGYNAALAKMGKGGAA